MKILKEIAFLSLFKFINHYDDYQKRFSSEIMTKLRLSHVLKS